MVRELFNRLRKSKKEGEPAAERRKRLHHWRSHSRAVELTEERMRQSVTTNKIEPWFGRLFAPQTEQATALYPFSAQTYQEVSFKKGDTLIVEFHQTGAWLEATNMITEKKGFIPANYITLEQNVSKVLEAWQDISRLEAEWKLLMSGLSPGTFILRPSSYANKSALSVLCNTDGTQKVKHYRITGDAATNEFKISSSKCFLSLDQLLRYYKEKVKGQHRLLSHPLPRPPPPALQAREVSICRSQVELGNRIDKGSFGRTYLATYRSCEVIAKRASSSKSRSTLLEVGKALHQLSHPHLIRLLGVCGDLSDDQSIMYITDYAPRGRLQDFLRTEEAKQLNFDKLLGFVLQVAEAMDYLENARSFHGDLRAANVFLATDFTVKVGNFGLNKILNDTEPHKQSRKYTLRWAAPETVKPGYIDSIKADVWSFAVLAFEVFTFASEPYADVNVDEIIAKVSTGYRLPNPSDLGFACEKAAYNLMLDCWSDEPEVRPTFRDVCYLLKDIFSEDQDIYASLD